MQSRLADGFPEDALILLAVRDSVMFPGVVLPISVSRLRSVEAVREATRRDRPIGIVLQRRPEVEEPDEDDLHPFGTQSAIVRFITAEAGVHELICKGEKRFRVVEFLNKYPFLAARVELIDEHETVTTEIERRMQRLKEHAGELLEMMPQVPSELSDIIRGIDSLGRLADFIAAFAGITTSEKQEILETIDVEQRLERILVLLARRIAVLRPTRLR
jgi:ATP-dependent Lon protease